MVKRATWRKLRDLRIGRFKVTLYREREQGSIFRAEVSEGTLYCGDIYFSFDDEVVLICHVGSLTIDDVLKILHKIEDYLQQRGAGE